MTRTYAMGLVTLVSVSFLCFIVSSETPVRGVIGAGFLSLTLGLITVAAAITDLGENR